MLVVHREILRFLVGLPWEIRAGRSTETKMKKHSLTYWKKKAWKAFSTWVRTNELDDDGNATCYTCGIKKHWKKMYAGHFVQGRRPSVLIQEEIVKVQCVGCNRFRHGNLNKFTPMMIEELGLARVLWWFKRAEQSVEVTAEEYIKLYKVYGRLVKERGIELE